MGCPACYKTLPSDLDYALEKFMALLFQDRELKHRYENKRRHGRFNRVFEDCVNVVAVGYLKMSEDNTLLRGKYDDVFNKAGQNPKVKEIFNEYKQWFNSLRENDKSIILHSVKLD